MATRFFVAAVMSVAAVSVALYMIPRRSHAQPPSSAATGISKCVSPGLCEVRFYQSGPVCVLSVSSAALQCVIPEHAEFPQPVKTTCFNGASTDGINYSVCDVIFQDGPRCVVSNNGGLQCNRQFPPAAQTPPQPQDR